MVTAALQTGKLCAGTAAKLCGKLGFCRTWALGRFGRGPMQPLNARAGGPGCGTTRISQAVRGALLFFKGALRSTRVVRLGRPGSTPAAAAGVVGCHVAQADAPEPTRLGSVVCVPPVRALDGAVLEPERWLHSALVVGPDTMALMRKRRQYVEQVCA